MLRFHCFDETEHLTVLYIKIQGVGSMKNFNLSGLFLILFFVIVLISAAPDTVRASQHRALAGFLEFNDASGGSYAPYFDRNGRLVSFVSENISDYSQRAGLTRESAVAAAREFLAANAELFGVCAPASLEVEKVFLTANIAHVLFSHYIGGKKVLGSEISLHINAAGNAVAANNNYLPITVKDPVREPALSGEDAAAIASAYNKCEKIRGRVRVGDVAYNASGALVYRVEIPSQKPLGDFVCVVDAGTGKVLENRNILQRADPLGSVYLSNPMKCKVTMEPLKYLKLAPDKKRLTGRWANVVNDKWVIIYPNEGDNYNYNATDSNFDELNAYYHTNIAHDYFAKFAFTAIDRPIKVIVHFGAQQDNAFYSPIEHVMGFGDGRTYNSFAKEESIIYHEYCHAVTNAIAALNYESESGAINEAFSDYFAGSMTNDPETGEWLAAKIKKPFLRTMENSSHYPEDITNEVHIDSQILSAALWDLREVIGAGDCDRLVHFSIYYLQGKPAAKFSDELLALVASDREHFGGKYGVTIKKVMAARGIAVTGTSRAEIEKALKFEALNGNETAARLIEY